MRRCEETRLHLYLDGELPAAEALEFEQHLMDCPYCRASYRGMRGVVDMVRGVKPLYEPPASSVEAAREIVQNHERKRVWRRQAITAAAAAALAVAVAALWHAHDNAPHGEFPDFAAGTHLRYVKGAMPLDVVSSDPQEVSAWLRARVPFHFEIPDYPAGEPQPYRLAGGRLLQYSNEDIGYVAYELRGEPVSLVMASTRFAAPSGGEVYRSGKLDFHYVEKKGLKLISWTDHGVHYSLVSSLGGRGAESCVVCHGSAGERRLFEDLVPDSR